MFNVSYIGRSLAVCLLLFSTLAQAQQPFATQVAAFNLKVSKVVADPFRSRVYAATADTSSVVVIDTDTFQILATIPVGIDPRDLAVSKDGGSLYVANRGSDTRSITVIDLDALNVRANFGFGATTLAVAAGLGDRLYVAIDSGYGGNIIQLDGNTGNLQATFAERFYGNCLLQTSPDGRQLYASGSNSGLRSYDISTEDPAELQKGSLPFDARRQLVVSPKGKYLSMDGITGLGGSAYATPLYSATDLNAYYGVLPALEAYPGPLAFSLDESQVYQIRQGLQMSLVLYDVATFTKREAVPFWPPSSGYAPTITAFIADHTGTYLFVGEEYFVMPNGAMEERASLVVYATGTGVSTTPTPVVTLKSTVRKAVVGGTNGEFLLSRQGGDLSRPIKVGYTVSGSAINNGFEYKRLKGSATIKAGQTSVKIKVIPFDRGITYSDKRQVILTLQTGSDYIVGTKKAVKVNLVNP